MNDRQRERRFGFDEQRRRSKRDLQVIRRRGESPTGDGRFNVRQFDVEEISRRGTGKSRQREPRLLP
jgi:hypothetical protein